MANRANNNSGDKQTGRAWEDERQKNKTLDDTGEQRWSGNREGKHPCLKIGHGVETVELIRHPEVKLTTTQTE